MNIKLSHYTKQRIVKRIIDVIMIAFLIITLFPIFWMVFSSFKDNTDILSGKIFLSRADNSCINLSSDQDHIYACTADGAIFKIKKGSGKPEKKVSVRSMATSFVMDSQYIWVATGDRGLIKIRKADLKTIGKYEYPAEGLNISKIASSVSIMDKGKLYITLEYKDYEKVFEFDMNASKFIRSMDIKGNLSPFQTISMGIYNGKLLIGGNKGLLVYDMDQERIISEYPVIIDSIAARVNDINVHNGSVYLGTSLGAMQFSIKSGKALKIYSISDGLASNQVGKIVFHNDQMLLGTNQGISIVNMLTGKVINEEKLFVPVASGKKSGEKLTTGNVTAMLVNGGEIVLGTSNGRLAYFDIGKGQPRSWATMPEGHVLVRWRNYVDLWYNINFGLYLKNSLIICGITMIISMVFATTAAYAFSRFKFPGSNLTSNLILATQMIPAIMYLIPIYIMFVKFTMATGIPMKGTYFGIILIYSAFFIPFSIWILRGFFAAIPVELEEAARIDGCSPIQVFWYIVLPLAVPGIIATGVYVFLTAWDELMFAWVLTNADTLTIPVGIRLFVGNYQNRFDLMMAAATVATIPVIVLFFMLQKYIVKGLTAGAVKG